MLFEQHQLQTPTINNNDGGGCSTANPLLSSLDFLLLDDLDFYLPHHSKKNNNNIQKHECLLSSQIVLPNDDEINNNNDEQQHQELFPDLDFYPLADFEEKSESIEHSVNIDDWELEKWISQSAFPSPPMDISQSPTESLMNNIEDSSSLSPAITWIGEECTIQSTVTDMTVPPSPPFSTTSSSPQPPARKSSKKSSLTITERKLRKKDQNKTAAEKYRIKKKSEKHTVLDRHNQLKMINRDLKLEAENLGSRIEQLKQLLVDLVHVQLPSTMESN